MTYETLLGICQLISVIIFGSMMLGILFYTFKPTNKTRFEAAARLALNDDTDSGEARHGH